jgi:cell division protein FtsB
LKVKKFETLEERVGDLIQQTAVLKKERGDLVSQLEKLSREREVISSRIDKLILRLEGKRGLPKE